MKKITLEKKIQDIPFREWISETEEVYVFKGNNGVTVINGVCPHFGGELYYDEKAKRIFCNLHSLTFCPNTMESNHRIFKKINSYRVINEDPIIIEK